MNVTQLIAAAGLRAKVSGLGTAEALAVDSDSRQVRPGTVFVALRGLGVDGHKYIPAALAAGASAVVSESPAPADLSQITAWVQVDDSGAALGPLASAFFGHPSRALKVLATTGTNGKTSVTWLLEQILRAAGQAPGVIGTVEVRFAGQRRPTLFTTPPADQLQALLAEMRDAGSTHAVIEASSHGLVQGRLGGTQVAVAGFTNLTRDHLDYHGTLEAYRAAKARLFEEYAQAACFNVDDPFGRELAGRFDGPTRTVSATGRKDADLAASDLQCTLSGSTVQLSTPDGPRTLRTRLLGRHNVENALVALGMAELAGVSLDEAIGALAMAVAPPGRLEPVDSPPGLSRVVVDYAHTPDALDNVLSALRPLVDGRLICVFGAGGDRDPGKRPQMAAVAARGADLVVVTSDNPRTEDPRAIVAQIVAGLPEGAPHHVDVDRRAAIGLAIGLASVGDLVLIAGKGHETYQIIGTEKADFDDRVEARLALLSLAPAAGEGAA